MTTLRFEVGSQVRISETGEIGVITTLIRDLQNKVTARVDTGRITVYRRLYDLRLLDADYSFMNSGRD